MTGKYYIEIADPLSPTERGAVEGPYDKVGDARRAIRSWPVHLTRQPTRRIRYDGYDSQGRPKEHWRPYRGRGGAQAVQASHASL